MGNYLVIGGSSGIGKSVCEHLSKTHSVFATYNEQETQDSKINYQKYDVLDDASTIDDIPEELDGIVYCPGSISLKPFARIPAEAFLEDYKLNVLGAIKSVQAVLPNLKKSKSASIVFFSTVAVQTGMGFHSIVASSKGAIEGLTKALSAELAPHIRVNCIAPSLTNTPLASGLLSSEEKIAASAKRHPLQRIGESKDIANAVDFLLNDSSSWITGQIIAVDGGMGSIRMI